MIKTVFEKTMSIWNCSLLNIRKWSNNPRLYIIAFLLAIFLYSMLKQVRVFCMEMGMSVTPWTFPFLMDNTFIAFIVMLGVLLLFCDAPFIDSHQPNILVRMGKTTWALGQILYIALASALYFAAVIVIANVIMIPYVGFSDAWGKIIGTLAQTNAGSFFSIGLEFNYHTMMEYTPLTAMAWSFLMAWLVALFLGLILFVINQNFGRGFGVAAALILLLLPLFVSIMGNHRELFALDLAGSNIGTTLYYFSPVSWAGLNSLDLAGNRPMPSRGYAVCVLIGLNMLLSVLGVRAVKRKNVDVLPPV